MQKIKIGIIKEGKTPPDTRVVLSPKQCTMVMKHFPKVHICVQASPNRCFTDDEYAKEGIIIQQQVNDCDILLGVKEVPIKELIADKTYFFFSHTIKKQAYNQKLLQAIVQKNIRLIDYECLVNEQGERIIAFGHWAGVVGAHNALWTWGKKFNQFNLPRAIEVDALKSLKDLYKTIDFPAIKIAVTGGGRVANGVFEILEAAGIQKVADGAVINNTFDKPVYIQLDTGELFAREADNGYEQAEFYANPVGYKCIIQPYLPHIDLFINAIYWNPKAPKFWTLKDMQQPAFGIKVIADITCDIAPDASIPSTLKASTIAEPVYGFDVHTSQETDAFKNDTIDVMAIDNLPNELPRDASENFGMMFFEEVMPELVKPEKSTMLHKASITQNGDLNKPFEYLRDYLDGNRSKAV